MQLMHPWVFCGVVAGACAMGATAQTLVVPHFFVETSQHPVGVPAPDPFLKRTALAQSLWDGHDANPQLAAQAAATDVMAGLTSSEIPAGKVALFMAGFGHNVEGAFAESSTRFFREEDRWEGLEDDDFDDLYGWPDGLNGYAKTYRHPFPVNAGVGQSGDPPLKAWFRAFCQEWVDMRQEGHDPYYPNLPDPDMFVFSSEPIPWKSTTVDRNCLKMLSVLATHTWWSTRQVPSYPTGTTLASLYGDAVSAFGFPASPNDATDGLALSGNEPTWGPHNRKFALWWRQIGQRVEDYVMYNCAYSLIAEYFPNAKYGDFEVAQADGQLDATGWFMDRIANSSEDRAPSRELPRGWIVEDEHAGDFFRENNGRWAILPKVASGNVDCPSLYRVSPQQWRGGDVPTGWDNYPVARFGHQQPHLYLPNEPLEDRSQTRLRKQRHALESSINSGPGEQNDRLWPWTELINQYPGDGTVVDEEYQRPLFALYRSKNLPGGILFTSNTDPNYPTLYPLYVDGWLQTSALLKRVYDPRITGYWPMSGAYITGEGDDLDTSRLDFTLRDAAGKDRVVGLYANDGITDLVVEFGNMQDYYTDPTSSWFWGFDITFECTTSVEWTIGQLRAMNWVTGDWDIVPCEEGNKYFFYTPNSGAPEREEEYQSRRTFVLPPGPYVRSDGHMLVRAIHLAGQAVNLRHDLVHVVPHMLTLEGAALRATQSDVNFDEAVDSADLVRYMNRFVAQEAAADVDLSGTVDATDLAAFVANYVNQE